MWAAFWTFCFIRLCLITFVEWRTKTRIDDWLIPYIGMKTKGCTMDGEPNENPASPYVMDMFGIEWSWVGVWFLRFNIRQRTV